MKALVLSAGNGTRLRPITNTSAKQLVPVANKPVLCYGLEAIAETGITSVGIIVGKTADEIREVVGDGSKFGLEVTYIPQEDPLGLAHAVLIAQDYLKEDDFVMYLGDNFIVGGIKHLVDEFQVDKPDAQILLTHVSAPQEFGIAELDAGGRVVSLTEKPEFPKSNLALAGVYLFTAAIHQAVRAIAPSGRGELEITDALQWLIDERKNVRAVTVRGYWKDTGNVADMLDVNRLVLESLQPAVAGQVDEGSQIIGRVRIERGAQVQGSRIVGPAIIGASTVVTDSYVGPFTSIAEDCRVEDSEIEYSIVLRDSVLTSVRRIHASLIGRAVLVAAAPRNLSAQQLVLGDHSRIRITS